MNLKQSIFLLLHTLLLFTCCNTTEPPIDELKPGRRDYTWTVDTLKIAEGRSLPSRMWGANANDVWAVGMAYLNAYCIWHFDGQSWTNYAPDKYIDPNAIWGFNRNNIWIGSLDGSFWFFNGSQWNRTSEVIIPNFLQFMPWSMSGNAIDNIYTVGFADSIDRNSYKSEIIHFDGSGWKLINISVRKQYFDQICYDDNSKKFLIHAGEFQSSNEYIYSFDGEELIKKFSAQEYLNLVQIGRNTFMNIRQKLYKYEDNKFELFEDFSSTNNVGNAWGRSEKDIFTINLDGIGHYNGTDLVTIFTKPSIEWSPDGGIVFAKDVFFIWDDSYNTFIVHGKLNNYR